MTAECHEVLSQLIHFDSSFDQEPSGTQKERIFQAIYLLLTYPLRLPLEKNVYGIAKADEFIAKDLQRLCTESPNHSVNQIIFDYIFDAAQIFKLEADPNASFSAWYNPIDHSVTVKSISAGTLEQTLIDMGTIVHESRHSEFFDHEIYCPTISSTSNSCDKGTNKSNGWEASIYWALLQGNEVEPLTAVELQTVARLLLQRTRYLYLLPTSWDQLKGPSYNPSSYKNLPTLQDVIRTEQLTNYERDYYSELVPKYCTVPKEADDSKAAIAEVCLPQLRSLLSLQKNPKGGNNARIEQALLKALHNLILYPVNVPLQKSFFGIDASSDLISRDLSNLVLRHPDQTLNQILFNYILAAIETYQIGYPPLDKYPYDFSSRSFFVPENSNPEKAEDVWSLTLSLIQSSRFSEIWPDDHFCHSWPYPSPQCEPDTNGGHGWAAVYLWALLDRDATESLYPSEVNYLYKQLCHQFDVMANLPTSLFNIRGLPCDKLDVYSTKNLSGS